MEGNESPTPPNGGEQKNVPRTRVYSRYPLPSDRHPFSAHFEILRRFVAFGRTQPVSAERVEGEGLPAQAASMNVRFMASVGLLKFESKGLYSPTPDTVRFVNARSVSDERARPVMRSILANSWFAQSAADLLRSQPIVTEDQIIGELALASETDKSKKEPALEVLLDYLLFSGIVSKGDKGLTLGEILATNGASMTMNGEGRTAPVDSQEFVLKLPPTLSPAGDTNSWLAVQTEDFYLKVRSTPEALDYLEDQLVLLRKRLNRKSQGSRPPEETEIPSTETPSH